MTGTLINGYANSLFPMMYRSSPRSMRDLGFKWSDGTKFASRYGRLETVTVSKYPDIGHRQSRGKTISKTVRVKPGIVPTIMVIA